MVILSDTQMVLKCGNALVKLPEDKSMVKQYIHVGGKN